MKNTFYNVGQNSYHLTLKKNTTSILKRKEYYVNLLILKQFIKWYIYYVDYINTSFNRNNNKFYYFAIELVCC